MKYADTLKGKCVGTFIFMQILIKSLLFVAIILSSCKESCEKEYFIKGKVTDNKGNSLGQANVFLEDKKIATTNDSGDFFYKYPRKTRSSFKGLRIRVEYKKCRKVYSSKFTGLEAGENVCGQVTLERNLSVCL